MSKKAKKFLRDLNYLDSFIYDQSGENDTVFLLSDLLHRYAVVYNEKKPGSPLIDIKLRRKKFIADVTEKFSNIYPADMITAFCDYWTQYNESGKKNEFWNS